MRAVDLDYNSERVYSEFVDVLSIIHTALYSASFALVWARLALIVTVRFVRLCVRHWSIHCHCPLKIAPME